MEFRCDENDPILSGLMSALPGSGTAANLPPDGLIQIENSTGTRLFLTQNSLVSLSVAPFNHDLRHPDSDVGGTSTASTRGPTSPAPFVLIPSALPSELHRVLIGHALAQEAEVQQAQEGICELSLTTLEEALTEAFRSQIDKAHATFRIPDLWDASLQIGLFAIGDGKAPSFDTTGDQLVSLVYHCHKQPKRFTGGGLRLFDYQIAHGVSCAASAFRDLEIDDNCLLMFPGNAVGAGLPVQCSTAAFADSLFAVSGAVRRAQASE